MPIEINPLNTSLLISAAILRITTLSRATVEPSIAERLNGSRYFGTVHETDPAIRIQSNVDGKDIIAALEIQSVDRLYQVPMR